jgi:hypothetical protein
MVRAGLLFLFLVGACGSEGQTMPFSVQITADGSCLAQRIAGTRSAAVDIYGMNGCLLETFCEGDVDLDGTNVVTAVLELRAALGQRRPAVSTPLEPALAVGITTYDTADCGGALVSCGERTLAQASGTVLNVTLSCNTDNSTPCVSRPACTEN